MEIERRNQFLLSAPPDTCERDRKRSTNTAATISREHVTFERRDQCTIPSNRRSKNRSLARSEWGTNTVFESKWPVWDSALMRRYASYNQSFHSLEGRKAQISKAGWRFAQVQSHLQRMAPHVTVIEQASSGRKTIVSHSRFGPLTGGSHTQSLPALGFRAL